MSAEPPPPDWVQSDAAFHHRRSILDGDNAGRTRSIPRVVLEPVPRASDLDGSILDDSERPATNAWQRSVVRGGTDSTSLGAGLVATVRREWEDLALTTRRLNRLVALLGFVVVLALVVYGWQHGTLSGMAAEIAGERAGIDGAPAAPRLSSDQVAWTDVQGEDDGRRSTASFASDRAFADPDDEPNSGAKLFVADGKKASQSEDESTSGTTRSPSRVAESGADGDESPGAGSRTGKRTETTTTVRYANCAEAAAAGAAPIRLGEPGYRLSLDQDKDGVACENGSTPEDPGDAPVDSLYSNQPTTTTSGVSATTGPGNGAGTTSTTESPTTSRRSTTGSTTTTATTATKPTSTASTVSTTTSTTIATTTTVSTSTTSPSTSSSTTTTRPSTTTTATTSTVPTAPPSTPTTVSTTIDPPPVDPLGGPPTGPT